MFRACASSVYQASLDPGYEAIPGLSSGGEGPGDKAKAFAE